VCCSVLLFVGEEDTSIGFMRIIWWGSVCSSVLRCVAVLQWSGVRCSVLQCVGGQDTSIGCSALSGVVQCGAVCGSVWQSIGRQYDSTGFCNCQFLTLQRTETHMDTLQHTVTHRTAAARSGQIRRGFFWIRTGLFCINAGLFEINAGLF